MSGYKVACVTIDYDSEYDDYRQIDAIGFRSETGGTILRTPGEVVEMIEKQDHTVVVEYKGTTTEVVAATDEGGRYVRSERTDTGEDALLKQPPC